jgi:hypothetical protein
MPGRQSAKQRQVGRESSARRGPSSRNAVNGSAPANLPMLRTSERGTMKRCEFLWDITYNQNLKSGEDRPALRFGTLVHKALAAYYIPGVKRGAHPAKAFTRAYKADLRKNQSKFGARMEEDDKWVDALELGVAMMENYVDEYGEDEKWEVLVTEHPFKVLVHHTIDRWSLDGTQTIALAGEPWFWYTGVLDGVWRNRSSKELWIPDHKSAASLSDSKLAYLQMDDQAGAYWSFGVEYLYASGILKPEQKLAGMLYNFMRKALPDERQSRVEKGKRIYLNLDGSDSKKQPSPYFMRMPIFRDEPDREMAKHRAMADFRRTEMLRSGELEIGKSPGQFTCPGCPARDICELHEVGADWATFRDQTTYTWDPYAEHEVYDGR